AGAVLCWGYNGYGQLGNNSTSDSNTPVQVSGLTSGIAAISAGYLHTCALTTAGAVLCWGDNAFGGLGNNTTTNSSVPVGVFGLTSGVTSVTAGTRASFALTATGPMAWGSNLEGQLGTGTMPDSSVPVPVSEP